MSRADWSFLENLLVEGQEYSTGIGRIWLTILFLFRMLVLGAAAESAWDDEQADFVCNTRQPGCTTVCYDKAFPISHFRFFVLQVIFVSTPTIFYFGYVATRAAKDKAKEEEKEGAGSKRAEVVTEGGDKNVTRDHAEEDEKQEYVAKGRKADKAPPKAPKLKGRLLGAYAFSILIKVLLEAGFIVGLWVLYDGFYVAAKFECTMSPCPHTVDCFVSRPTEKTIFTIYSQAIAAISLILNLVELLHLLQLAVTHRLEKCYRERRQDFLPRPEPVPTAPQTPELRAEAPREGLPPQGEAARYSNPCESYGDLGIEMNWAPGEAQNDLLPSYVKCMGAMKTHTPRVHYKKHEHHPEKHCKGAKVHKGQSKQKHYV